MARRPLPAGDQAADLVSLDRGGRWQRPTMRDRPVALRSAVELPDGGWLGTTTPTPGRDRAEGNLVRSDDGVHWSPVIDPDACDGVARSTSWYTPPAPFGDGWLVSYTCENGIQPHLSQLYLLDADGSNPRLVEGTPTTGAAYGPVTPLADGAAITQAFLHEVPTGAAIILRP